MNVFVTVGTTRFDTLVQACDRLSVVSEHQFTIQHANQNLSLSHAQGDAFFDNISQFYQNADIVITHAGAGSIFRLLEMNKKIIVVPNFERVDKHQSDIARYVEDNNFGVVCWTPDELAATLARAASFCPSCYVKDDFFKFEEITQIIRSL